VPFTAQPSATQKCGDPAAVTAAKAVTVRLKDVRKAKWSLTVPLTSTGVGHVDATLQKGKKKIIKLATAALEVKAGALSVKLALPKGQRRAANLTLVLVTTAPDGTRRATTTVAVRVAPERKATHKTKKRTTKKKGARR
jgi:hypothetical protein